jgi:hypothetical protein
MFKPGRLARLLEVPSLKVSWRLSHLTTLDNRLTQNLHASIWQKPGADNRRRKRSPSSTTGSCDSSVATARPMAP